MKVFVLTTLIGPDDTKLVAGEVYDLPEQLAQSFIKKGWVREEKPPKPKKVIIQEVKKTTKRPVKK